jgi:hypothetical protein
VAEASLLGSPHRKRPPIEQRKAERELFFWTAFQALKLVIAFVFAIYAVISLIRGELPGGDLLVRSLGGS